MAGGVGQEEYAWPEGHVSGLRVCHRADGSVLHSLALAGIKRYGGSGVPWFLPDVCWNSSQSAHTMNIFLPDPLRRDQRDWRAKDYLNVNRDSVATSGSRPYHRVHQVTDWVDFLIEYHTRRALRWRDAGHRVAAAS